MISLKSLELGYAHATAVPFRFCSVFSQLAIRQSPERAFTHIVFGQCTVGFGRYISPTPITGLRNRFGTRHALQFNKYVNSVAQP